MKNPKLLVVCRVVSAACALALATLFLCTGGTARAQSSDYVTTVVTSTWNYVSGTSGPTTVVTFSANGPNGTVTMDMASTPGADLSKLGINSWVIVDATPSTNPNFVPTNPSTLLNPSFSYIVQAGNYTGVPYVGMKPNETATYYYIHPYANYKKLGINLNALNSMFSSVRDPVYITKSIGQDSGSTPADAQSISSNPINVWPINIVSSAALDAMGNLRMDMQNATWTEIKWDPSTTPGQLMSLYGDYGASPTTHGNPWSVTFEHVIFSGGNAGSGGGLQVKDFSVAGITTTNKNFPTAILQGDMAFVNNLSNGNGTSSGGAGLYYTGQDLKFKNNVYFVGNKTGYNSVNTLSGMTMPGTSPAGGWAFNSSQTALSNNGLVASGGGMRIYTGGYNAYFLGQSYFIGNLTANFGGGLAVATGGLARFDGKATFIGNQAGLVADLASSTNGAGGGISGLNGNCTLFFNNEVVFIGNIATGPGGGIAAAPRVDTNGSAVTFAANALFTDNQSGMTPVSGTLFTTFLSGSGVLPPSFGGATVTGTGAFFSPGPVIIGGIANDSGQVVTRLGYGGAIYQPYGAMNFKKGAQATFLRNYVYGGGGAIGTLGASQGSGINGAGSISAVAALFNDNATFVGNVAAVNGGAIAVGTLGTTGGMYWATSSSQTIAGSVYFTGQNRALVVQDNMSYWGKSGTNVLVLSGSVNTNTGSVSTGTMMQFGGGGFFATAGVYIEDVFSFLRNQTGGSGGAVLVGFTDSDDKVGSNKRPTLPRMGTTKLNYSFVANPMDWMPLGSYLRGGNYAMYDSNVAVDSGGALGALGSASVYIGSGAQFVNNAAGGDGGAIAMGLTIWSSTWIVNTGTLDIRARVDNVVFKNNLAGATINTVGVDYTKLIDPELTSVSGYTGGTTGRMIVTPNTGHLNDIYVDRGSIAGTGNQGTINIDAYAGMQVYFNGGIEMNHSGTKNVVLNINRDTDKGTLLAGSAASVPTNAFTGAAATPTGLVWFDNASANVEAITNIGSGILRISGTSGSLIWGSATASAQAGTLFSLGGSGTLEANATINANSITIGDKATVRVLGSAIGPGTLTFNQGADGIAYSGAVNLAGNGRINAGQASLDTIASISVGDAGHTTAQTLNLAQNATTMAAATLNNTRLNVGLFAGNKSDNFHAGAITLSGNNTIALTSLANGTFNVATSDSAIAGGSIFTLTYLGSVIKTGGRLTVGAVATPNNIVVNYAATNQVSTWNAGGATWDINTAGEVTGQNDSTFIYGDVAVFGANAANSNVALAANILGSGMSVAGNYTFTGAYGIATDKNSTVAALAGADGALTKTGAATMLVLANTAANNFAGGVNIQSGTLSVRNAAQLGTGLNNLRFQSTSAADNATLLVTGSAVFDGAANFLISGQQRLNLAPGNIGNITVSPAASLAINNNTVTGTNGGALNVGAGATLNLNALGNVSVIGNNAVNGGGMALDAGGAANIYVDTGKTVTFGVADSMVLNTVANTSVADSIYGVAGSVINKTGAGVLSVNSDSSKYAGAINVNAGSLIVGKGGVLGAAGAAINITGPGSTLGGAATIGGNVTMDPGTILLVGRAHSPAAETINFANNLTLDNVTLHYDGNTSMAGAYTPDLVNVNGLATLTGTTTFDFTSLSSSREIILTSGTTIASAYSPGFASGTLDSAGLFTYSQTTFVSGTTVTVANPTPAMTGSDFVVTTNGVTVGTGRFDASVAYLLASASTGVLTGTNDPAFSLPDTGNLTSGQIIDGMLNGSIFVGGTAAIVTNVAYDTTKLELISKVYNQVLYWTGSSGTTSIITGTLPTAYEWTLQMENWYMPAVPSQTRFAHGDSIIFADVVGGTTIPSGTIAVDGNGVFVADLTFTGTQNWELVGGPITSNAAANNFKDAVTGTDLSQGALILDSSYTGMVTLANTKVTFRGVMQSGTLSDGIIINGGTLKSTVAILNDNVIINNSALILNDPGSLIFTGVVRGTGDIYKTDAGTVINLTQPPGIEGRNLYIQAGAVNVGPARALTISGTVVISPLGTLIVQNELNAANVFNQGTLVENASALATSNQWSTNRNSFGFYVTDANAPPPGFGLNTATLDGNYVGAPGSYIALTTYRYGAFIENFAVNGNSSGTSTVVIRNVSAMPKTNTNSSTGYHLVAGDATSPGYFVQNSATATTLNDAASWFAPDGQITTVSKPVSQRDVLIFKTSGSTNLKLTMDWADSYLPSAVIVVTSTVFDASGTVPLLDDEGNVMTTSVTTDYSESPEDYILVQGADKNWYFQNPNSPLSPQDAPFIAASPAIADLMGVASLKAVAQRINARHDMNVEHGWSAWTNYTHSEDRIRAPFYDGTTIKENIFQVGADYTLASDKEDSKAPRLTVGAAYAYTDAKAISRPFTLPITTSSTDTPQPGYVAYQRVQNIAPPATLTAKAHTASVYGSLRWWHLYLDATAQYSSDKFSASVPGQGFDVDGNVKGSRMALSSELGAIITAKGAGQLEIYAQASGQKYDFKQVSSIDESTPISTGGTVGDLTVDDPIHGRYNAIYDPTSPNGRRYHFDSPTTGRAELGLRWGSNIQVTKDISFRPWGGLAYGRNFSNSYLIHMDQQSTSTDMRGNFYTFRGGAAARWRTNTELYLTLEWTGGRVTNNYTLMSGLNYHW